MGKNEDKLYLTYEAIEACLEDYGDPLMAENLIAKAVENYDANDSIWFMLFGNIAYEKLKNTELAQSAYLKAMKSAHRSLDIYLVLDSSFRFMISHEIFIKYWNLGIARAEAERNALTLGSFTILAHEKLHDRKLAETIFMKAKKIAQSYSDCFNGGFFEEGIDEFLSIVDYGRPTHYNRGEP